MRLLGVPDYRVERDTLGEIEVPSSALYGAQTQRAVENFPISGQRLPPAFIRVLGLIKACAARVNEELGELPRIWRAPLGTRRNRSRGASTQISSWSMFTRPAAERRPT